MPEDFMKSYSAMIQPLVLPGTVRCQTPILRMGGPPHRVGHSSHTSGPAARAAVTPDNVQNTAALGQLLYDKYILLFQLAGLILLVAMIGAIVLTLRHRKDVKRQNVLQQMWRDPAKAMELMDVKPGQGL